MRTISLALWALLLPIVSGCQPNEIEPNEIEPNESTAAAEVTNRIPIPLEVVSNIGITFEKAERGKLGRWLRVPGRLEVPHDRRWTVRAPALGRVHPRVRVGDVVEKGRVLAVLESPALLEERRKILIAANAVKNAQAEAQAAAARLTEAESLLTHAVEFESTCLQRRTRMVELLPTGSDSGSMLSSKELIDAEQTLVDARSRSLETAVLRDDLKKRSRRLRLEIDHARIELDQQLTSLSVLTGQSLEGLRSVVDGAPLWQTLSELELRAPSGGMVMAVAVSDGEHVPEATPIVRVSNASTLAFTGFLPESDLDRLSPGAFVRLESAGMGGKPVLTKLWDSPPTFDEASRTLRIRAWVANPSLGIPDGTSATAYVQVSESEKEEVLVPEACVVFDGLEAVVFRRDSADPDVAVRTPVELGERSAGLVEVLAGVLVGTLVIDDAPALNDRIALLRFRSWAIFF